MFKKQGETKEITTKDNSEFKDKPVVRKSSIITIKDGKPKKVFFDENGKYAGEEDV